MNEAATTIQSFYRSCYCRRLFLKQRRSAEVIQTWWKGVQKMQSHQAEYKKIRQATIALQSGVRGMLIRREISRCHSAAVKMQAIWRGRVVRKALQQQHKAATIIQAYVRCILQYKKYVELKASALAIQQWWRHLQVGLQIKEDFVKKKKAAVTIQTCVRRYLVQIKIERMNEAATTIQGYYRSYYQRRLFIKQRQSAEIIQIWWKGIQTMQSHKARYKKIKQATIVLQAGVRGMLTRRAINNRHNAAVKIQARFRGWSCMKEYQTKKQSVNVIKRWWTSVKRTQSIQNNYQDMRKAIVILQAYVRGMLVRKNIRAKNNAALKIQSHVRGYLVRRRCETLCQSAICIQRWWQSVNRVRMQQKEYMNLRECIIKLQACTRGMIVRRKTKQQHEAAIIIQSHVRRWLASRSYQKKVAAVVKIQKTFRSLRKTRELQSEYQALRKATITLQSSFRGMLVRTEIARQRNAQMKIASLFRGWCVRKKYNYQRIVRSVTVIQRWWRTTKITREKRRQYCHMKKAAIVIQAYTRGMIVRKTIVRQRRAAIRIQSHFRGWAQRRKNVQTVRAAIKIQSCVRCWQEHTKYLKRREKIVHIQRWWRATMKTRQQAKEYRNIRRATITLQAHVRGMFVRREISKQHKAALKIQSHVRQWLLQKQYLQKIQSTLIIQNWWRRVLLTRKQKTEYQRLKESTVVLQAYARGMLIRRTIKRQRKAAVTIQSHVRCWSVRRTYQKKMVAVIKLQRYWRGAYITLRARERYIYLQRASVILQTAWRGRQARKHFKRVKAARCIQAYVRGWQVRRLVKEERRRLMLQRITKVTKVHLAAITIQRCYRRHKALVQAQQTIGSIVKLQRWVRARLLRSSFLRKRTSAIIIQRAWRKRHEQRRKDRHEQAASTIQAAWRGRTIRQSLGGKKLEELRKRLAEATRTATDSKRIGNRTICAINYLTMYKDLKRMLIAVMYLDTSTRWSPPCCVKLTEGIALQMLVFILQKSNRSIPHMQIVSYVLNIFINLAKYPTTAQHVHKLEGLFESIIQMMTIHYEKGPGIFCKCCTLLYIFTTSNPRHTEMSSMKVKGSLNSLKSMMIRRENTSLRGQRPTKYTPLPASQLPGISPEWSLKGGKIREFDNPILAIVTLLSRLEMTSK